MKASLIHGVLLRCTAAIGALLLAQQAQAITVTINRNVEMNDGGTTGIPNRPFFTAGGPDGYVGTATPDVDTMTTVTNPDVGIGGNSTAIDAGNNIPMGVGFNFGVQFTVQTGDPNHFLSDAGNPGLGVNSGVSDTNPVELSTNEQLFFSTIQLTNVSIRDPIGQLQPGASVANPRWQLLRSATFMAPTDFASTSSDAAVTADVKMFDDVTNSINNNYIDGTFGPLNSVYITTTGGDWPLKGIRYQVDINYELAPAPPTRRTFHFGEVQPGTYEGGTTHTLADLTHMDSNVTITAIGADGILDTNLNGVGVNSTEDDFTLGLPTGDNAQRFIDGSLTTPEAIHFSFDRDVALESLTLSNLHLDGTEGVVLSFVSGTNPFTGLSGYSGDYTLGATSLTYNTSGGGQIPYTVAFGMSGQDAIQIEAGTVLSLTSNPVAGNGFLLDIITVHVEGAAGPDADFDNDNDVDDEDLAIWNTNFGSTTATDATGDADGDGDADGNDFLQWQREVHAASPMASSVPEPTSAWLLLAAAAWLAHGRPRASGIKSPSLEGRG